MHGPRRTVAPPSRPQPPGPTARLLLWQRRAPGMANPKLTPFALRMVGFDTPATTSATNLSGSTMFATPFLDGADGLSAATARRSPRSPVSPRSPTAHHPDLHQCSPAQHLSVYQTPWRYHMSPVQPSTGRTARLEGPRPVKLHERQQLTRTSIDDEHDTDPWQCGWLWSEASMTSLENCAVMASRDGRVVAAAVFAVRELETRALNRTGTTLRLGLTDTRSVRGYSHQSHHCLRSVIRQQESQRVLLSILSSHAAELGAGELAKLGFCATENVDTYTLLRSDADRFHYQPDIVVSLLDTEPTDDVLQALQFLHGNERSPANYVVRNLAQTRRIHTLPSTFTKIARRVQAPASVESGRAPSDLAAYIICRYPAKLSDGTIRPLAVVEGCGEAAALGMLIRDALLERRQQPTAPRFENSPQEGASDAATAVVHASSVPNTLGNLLLVSLDQDQRRVSARGGQFVRISQPVELLRTLAGARMLGTAAHAVETQLEFSLTIYDEDDATVSDLEREVPGILVRLRYIDSTQMVVAQESAHHRQHADDLRRGPLLGIDCVRGDTGLDTSMNHHDVDSSSEHYVEVSQPPGLSVSALGREVEAMGTRVAHWSASRPAHSQIASTAAAAVTRRWRRPVGRVVQRQDGGVQVFRPDELGESATRTQNWLWNCCGAESSSDRPPADGWALGGAHVPLSEGVPPSLRASRHSGITSPFMNLYSSSGLGRADVSGHSDVAGVLDATAVQEEGDSMERAGRWIVESTNERSPSHATVSRAQLCGALFASMHERESVAGPTWLRKTIGCESLNLSDLDWC